MFVKVSPIIIATVLYVKKTLIYRNMTHTALGLFQTCAMYLWLVLACCALAAGAAGAPAGAGAGVQAAPPAHVATTTRRPARTLDRHAAELAWRSWLQSPESGNPSAPPRRITTKSLFITPLVCPKGQRLDSDGCVQVSSISVLLNNVFFKLSDRPTP